MIAIRNALSTVGWIIAGLVGFYAVVVIAVILAG